MLTLIIFLNIYFVSFIDKPEKTAPQLSERAWKQRQQWNIPTDQMDYPVSPTYQGELTKMGVKILHKSRWFNGVTCEMSDELAHKVYQLKFVTDVELTRSDDPPIDKPAPKYLPKAEGEGNVTDAQLQTFNLLKMHEAGFKGQGILMAICDGGFSGVDTMSCFRHKELELGHFDFTDDPEDFYGSTGNHGTACLSTITGIDAEQHFYGAATQAKYYLMRTEEYHTESPKEMDNLVAALEKADSLGVNIVSISLGYYYFNDFDTLPKEALDGRTIRASRAATIAARKGMLVCAAAGNEGNKNWQTICVPADADSILTVGAVGTDSIIGAFSSYGPSADWRIKPDVCAVGKGATVIKANGIAQTGNGTSYATPLLAGLAASLWSAMPKENAMQIRQRILRSADRYYTPDKQRYGYGIPDAWKAYTMKLDDESNYNGIAIEQESVQKIIRGDQILIIRHGHIYNLTGQIVR